ncbi:hypothetical protein LRO89_27580 [Priestia megaterium]|uniref:hypothetical protein n=1 Tax=Priestia megaterium TaxID=1404 RepID=UPI0039C1831D
MREKNSRLLIEECEETLEQIKNKFDEAFQDPSIKEITIPKVKSFLEHCRSILEYIAKDIFEMVIPIEQRTRKLNSKGKDKEVYFPYGKYRKIFKSSVSKNLPGLKNSDPVIYNLLESIQDYQKESDNVFLTYMCKLTNDNKHDDLTENERKSNLYTNVGNIARVAQGGQITFNNCSFDGVPSGNFSIRNGKIEGNINPALLNQVFNYEEGHFVFKDTKKDVLIFLRLVLDEITNFVNDIYDTLRTKYI